jgi:ferredoxin
MRIDPEVCIGYEECLVYCPVGAIHMGDDVAEIERLPSEGSLQELFRVFDTIVALGISSC